jgi:hypothetical protein
MVPTRRSELSVLWTGLYLTIANIRQHVLREREMAGSWNVPISDFPNLTKDVVKIVRLLADEVREEHLDGLCVEYFVQNDVADTLVTLAVENVPEGFLNLVVGLYTALLSSLPPSFFLNERISAPLRNLLVACRQLITTKKMRALMLQFLDSLTTQIQRYPPLSEILLSSIESKIVFYSIVQDFLERDTEEEMNEIVLRAFEAGLIKGPEGEALLISLVFSLIETFSHQSVVNFVQRFGFLERCLQAGRQDPQLSPQLISAYRDHFVDRIFSSSLLGSSTTDGSLARILDLLIELGECVDIPDLYIPLLSKTIRILEKLPDGESDRIKALYIQTLTSRPLCQCFPTMKPTRWTESISLHRQRLDSLMSHLGEIGLSCFRDISMISDFYRMHLMVVDRLLGSDLTISSVYPGDVPQILETGLVLDTKRNTKLIGLLSSCKTELQDLWRRPVIENLSSVRLILGCAALMNTTELYDELSKSSGPPESALFLLERSLKSAADLVIDEGIVEPMFSIHMQHDALNAPKWDPSIFVHDTVINNTANAYLLGHAIMRQAAILQVRATRSSIAIIYE